MDYAKTPNFRPSVQNSLKLPSRSAYVSIEYNFDDSDEADDFVLEDGMKVLYGLNTRFNVEYNMGNVYPRAQIDVCNASREVRDYLTNYTRIQHRNKRIVELRAGYLQPGDDWHDTPLLFTGYVIFTFFTAPPDIWTCMQTVNQNDAALSKQEWTVKGTITRRQLLEIGAAKLGLKFDSPDKLDGTVENFQSSGDGKRLLRDLQLACPNYAVYIDGGTLKAVFKERDEPMPGETVWTIREDTGLVGIPSVVPKGVDCEVLLNPKIRPGDWINLQSVHQPVASGLYRILKLRHHGELRGTEFYTALETTRPAVWGQNNAE